MVSLFIRNAPQPFDRGIEQRKMEATIERMATKKPKPSDNPPAADRHKPGSKMARIRGPLASPAEAEAIAKAMDFTEWVNIAVREKLEREGLWPPNREK